MRRLALACAALVILAFGYREWRSHARLPVGTSAITPLDGVISAGPDYALAIGYDSSIYGWGDNDRQQLGLANVWHQLVPARIPTEQTWRSVHAGTSASYAIAADGALWRRAIGHRMAARGGSPILPPPTSYESLHWDRKWTKVEESWSIAAGLDTEGNLWLWDDRDVLPEAARDVGGRAEVELTRASPGTTWIDFCLAMQRIYAISADGRLWGDAAEPHTRGTSPSARELAHLAPIGSGTHFRRVFCRENATQVVAIDSEHALWGFGKNAFGELGDGVDTSHSFAGPRPMAASAIKRLNDMRWSDIAVAPGFTLGIAADGSLWAWGINTNGMLGTGDLGHSDIPKLVDRDHIWTAVAAGYDFSLGLTRRGEIFAWGDNSKGAIGDGGASITRMTPTRVSGGIHWRASEAGVNHADE